jgi:hypothetical protein
MSIGKWSRTRTWALVLLLLSILLTIPTIAAGAYDLAAAGVAVAVIGIAAYSCATAEIRTAIGNLFR